MRRILLVCAFLCAGCSGVKNGGGTGGGTQNAVVSGPYSAVATSTKGNGIINVYANLSMQSTSSFSASTSTLVCPGNDPGSCTGDGSPATFTLTGTVSGNNVQMTLQFTNASGADTITLMGTVSGTTLSGTYTDSQGDAGTWTATQSGSLSGNYSGSVNSTPNPLQTAPTISAQITEAQNLTLTGSASVTNSPCYVTLDFSQGMAIGGAFTLTDTTKDVTIIGVPVGSSTFSVFYVVGASAVACAGDFGTGTFALQ